MCLSHSGVRPSLSSSFQHFLASHRHLVLVFTLSFDFQVSVSYPVPAERTTVLSIFAQGGAMPSACIYCILHIYTSSFIFPAVSHIALFTSHCAAPFSCFAGVDSAPRPGRSCFEQLRFSFVLTFDSAPVMGRWCFGGVSNCTAAGWKTDGK